MTYNVFGGTLNLAQSVNHLYTHKNVSSLVWSKSYKAFSFGLNLVVVAVLRDSVGSYIVTALHDRLL